MRARRCLPIFSLLLCSLTESDEILGRVSGALNAHLNINCLASFEALNMALKQPTGSQHLAQPLHCWTDNCKRRS